MEKIKLDQFKPSENLQINHKSPRKASFPLKTHQNKPSHKKTNSQLFDLKQKFQRALYALVNTETRQTALKECQHLINSNRSAKSLILFASSLTDLQKSNNALARCLEVSLLGYLSEVYQENLAEKNDSLKLLIRIAEAIQSYFKDLNRDAHKSAAEALCDLYRYSLPKGNQELVFIFMFEPLQNILITGSYGQIQRAAALALFVWTECLTVENNKVFLDGLYSKVLTLFFKCRAEFEDLLKTIGRLTDVCGLQLLGEQLGKFLEKMNLYLRHPSSNAYELKTTACQLLGHVGKYLIEIKFKLDPFPNEILEAFKDLKLEKFLKLQNKARDALKIWDLLKNSLFEQPSYPLPVTKVQKLRPNTQYYAIRALTKMQKKKINVSEEINPEILWGSSKGKYLKKRSGSSTEAKNQFALNISKAVENRTKNIEAIKKRQTSPEGLKILYKKDNQILQYENEPLHNVSEVENSFGDVSSFFTVERSSGDFSANFIAKALVRDVPNRSLSNCDEKNGEEWFESNQNVPESFYKVDSEQFVESLNKTEEKSSLKFTETTNLSEIKVLEKLGDLPDVQEDEKEFKNFIEEDLKNKEMKPAYQQNSIEHSDQLFSDPKAIFEKKELDFTPEPQEKSKLAMNPSQVKTSETKKSDKLTSLLKVKNMKKIDKPQNSDFNLKEQSSESFVNAEEVKLENEFDLIRSQSIHIEPTHGKRSKIRNLSIEVQNSFTIYQDMAASSKPAVALNRQPDYIFKEFHSKLVQTEINNETPCFSIDIKNKRSFSRNFVNFDKIFGVLDQQLGLFQVGMEEKFFIIGNELKMMEERLEWADETCKCLKKFREAKKNIKKSSEKFTQSINVSEKFTQPDKVSERLKINAEIEKFDGKMKNVDELTCIWASVLEILEKNDYSQAFEKILETEDDLYLIRLVAKLKPCFGKVNRNLSRRVLRKLIWCLESRFIEDICIQWISAALEEKKITRVMLDVGKVILEALDNVRLKGGEDGEKADRIFRSLSLILKENNIS